MASDEQFSLCWNNFHANMSAGFHGLLSRGDLVDVTLAAEGRLLQAHKLVLSVCSPYFQEMFKMNPTQHPIVFLKDVSHSALRDLLQFMYQGEVNVKQEELASFISTAEQLQVKGLTGNQNEESSTPSKPKPTSRPGPRSSQQRQSVMTKLETDLDSKPSTTPVAVKRPNRPSIASNNSSSSQSGPAKRKCVDPLEAGPSGSAKEEFVTIPDEDENNAVAPKMEPEFVNESMWDDDDDGANNEETNFGEDDSNMEMTAFDGSTTGDGNITGGGEGGAVGDAQDMNITFEILKNDDILVILNAEDDQVELASEDEDSQAEDNVLNDDDTNYITDEIDPLQDLTNTETESHSESISTHISGNLDQIYHVPDNILRGKNGHEWLTKKDQTCHIMTPAIKETRKSGGPSRMCKNIFDPVQIFNLFITDEIVSEIVKWTNVEMSSKRQNKRKISATERDTTNLEIRAFIGILVLTAAMKDNHLSVNELFDPTFSGTRYISVMSKQRFEFLISCLRMDDKSLRPALRPNDPFIPIRNVWDLFIKQCRMNYVPGSEVTIDEQLLGFRGKCPFKIHIPNKAVKYGIKFPMMCDATTRYMIDADPYIGSRTNTEGMPLGEYYVKKLSSSIHGSNRNVTCDNWFISVPLAKDLIEKPYKLTIVGAIRSDKLEIPEKMKHSRARPVGSSMSAYDGSLTLVSYKQSSSKMIYLLSSCDESKMINNSSGKPDILNFYNQTKTAVDSCDRMCSIMSCSRKTNRWPTAVFYGILNMAFLNSAIIYVHNMFNMNQKPLSRREFMKQLSADLVKPWMETRVEVTTLKRSVRDHINQILDKPLCLANNITEDESEPKKRKYCSFCSYKKKRMSKLICCKCKKSVCGEHKVNLCLDCLK
ncbi:uncharacterized protein LOC111355922 isoform X1 [Spodoptera litura]|uniref:Uncharacterized protein LOC111355922 isoform X1 n=1 Tax=Spodoptera litura TaxID=69820 RepID=A0A9J7E7F1_SPOLT|nr:uncharacterized protein LOC111355922 isoform X1 [Spodoptera litura]